MENLRQALVMLQEREPLFSVGDLFKPTSLEGFAPDTLFRPELTGADYGRTAPAERKLRGRPEIVSASHAYEDLLEPDAEVELLVLPFRRK